MTRPSTSSGSVDHEWCFDLISPDEVVRSQALKRHVALLERRGNARRSSGTIEDLLPLEWSYSVPTGIAAEGRHHVLYVQWSEHFTAEWRRSGWATPARVKRNALQQLALLGHTPQVRAAAEDLVIGAVRREHRRGDLACWMLARSLAAGEAGADFRTRLVGLHDDALERTRLRADFLVSTFDRPGSELSHRAWTLWRRNVGKPLTHPVTARELAAMPNAEAVDLLLGLTPQGAADCLEGLEPGPATRMLTAMGTAPAALRAVERMDVKTAVHVIDGMSAPDAAALLTALDPAAAGPLFPAGYSIYPHLSRGDLIDRMPTMRAQVCANHLEYVGPEDAARALAVLEPAIAAEALEETYGDDRYAVPALRAMPSGQAEPIIGQLSLARRAHVRAKLAS